MTNQVRSTDAAQVVGEGSREDQQVTTPNPIEEVEYSLASLDESAAVGSLPALPLRQNSAEFGDRIREVLAEGGGFWRSCSGCYETEDGQNVHGYPASKTFGCIPGGGCGECGGLGVIWDTTDYDAMASSIIARDNEQATVAALLASKDEEMARLKAELDGLLPSNDPKRDKAWDAGYNVGCHDTGEELRTLRDRSRFLLAVMAACAEQSTEARNVSLSLENEGLRKALEHATETLAEHIYNDWCSQQGWVEWVPRGNSLRQDDARQAARAALSPPPPEGLEGKQGLSSSGGRVQAVADAPTVAPHSAGGEG